MGTVNVFLGPSATSQNSADYSLSGWDKDGSALTLTSWTWTETGNGGYVLSHANLIPGCSYWLRKTSGGTPWVQGEIGANVIADIQSGLATAAQVSAIGSGTGAALNFEAAQDNASGAIIGGTTKVGTQTLTYASTTADNGVYHDIAHAGNAIDWVYGFSVGGGRNASKVTFNGQYVVAAPVAGKNISVYAWNFTGTPAWQLMKTIPGQASGGTDVTVDIALLSAHTGTGADAGKVYVRFAAGTDAVTLKVDQLLLQAQNLGQTIGYANGSIWLEADGGNAGVTPYVDGTGDNPCTYAAGKTLSTALGIKRFIVTPGTSITLDAALTGTVMTGRSYTLALGGQNISSSYFEGIESLSGIGTTATGEAIFCDCHAGTVTLGEFDFVRCHIHGTVTLNAASKYYRMHDCTGIENAVVEFGAATQTLALSRMSGAITITGMTTGDTLLVDGDGVLTLGATCDGGTVHISGNIELTNSGSGQTITYGATKFGNMAHGGTAASLTLGDTHLETALDGIATVDGKVDTLGGNMNGLILVSRDIGSMALATPQGWNWAVAATPTATFSETLPDGAYVTAYYVTPGATSGTEIFKIEYGIAGNVLTNVLGGEIYYSAGTRLWFEICPGNAANFPAGTLTVNCQNTVIGSGAATDSVFELPEVVYCDNYIALADGTVEPFGGRHVIPTTASAGGTSVAAMIAGGIAREATVLGQFNVTQGIIVSPSVSDNSTLTVVRGDTRTITFNLGTAWPLTGKKVYFTYKKSASDTTEILSAECTVTDAVNGIATYTPATTAFPTAGKYAYDVCVTETDGSLPQTAFIGTLKITQDVKA